MVCHLANSDKTIAGRKDMTPEVQKWIDFINGEVAIFVPYADRLSIIDKCPNGRYELSDRSYRFPLLEAKKIIDSLPPGFQFSDEFLDAIANDEATNSTPSAAVKIEKRVILLPDEDQNRMIAVFGLPEFPNTDVALLGKIKKSKGTYEPSDRSWRFPVSEICMLDLNFPEPEFSHDENFSKAFDLDPTVYANQSTKRVDILLDAHPDEMVAIYAPYNHLPTLKGIVKLKAHYVSDDKSWRCSISAIDSVREAFPSPEYHHSEEFLRQLEPIDCGF